MSPTATKTCRWLLADRPASGPQNLGGGNYQFNWKSPKNYRNSCKKLLLDLGDGSTRFALFQFK